MERSIRESKQFKSSKQRGFNLIDRILNSIHIGIIYLRVATILT
uniref:Transposase n=1 Tax=Ascaris lumbricoides TaxID=6252 RepID=A0A0M3HI08_ASCLU